MTEMVARRAGRDSPLAFLFSKLLCWVNGRVRPVENLGIQFGRVCVRALRFFILLTTTVAAHVEADPIGCYSVLVGETNASPLQPMRAEHLVRAKDIRLTSARVTTPWAGGQIFQVLPLNPADEFTYRASYWQLKRERLSITWSNNGLSGVEMILAPTPIGFEGTIESFWDFEPSTSDRRRTVLTRKRC
jgi:hypothetical protein